MISVFYNNKSTLNRCEDTLTASLFDLLKYLPYDMFWAILKNSLLNNKLPIECGEIEDIVFWPKWDPTNTSNKNFIEPDVFIRTHTFDLIIEAKRYDTDQQSEHQFKSEVTAYNNEFADDNKPLYFIQLGGLRNLEDIEDLENVIVCKTDWTKLLHQIYNEYKKIENISYPQINAYKRILKDLVITMKIHGFYRKLWLQTLETDRVNNSIDKFKFIEYAKR